MLLASVGYNSGYEVFSLLECNAVYSVETQLAFWGIMSSPSSGLKNKPSKKLFATCFHSGFSLGLFFDPGD
jgi:hypothetical protein